jgi:hypothetical protein
MSYGCERYRRGRHDEPRNAVKWGMGSGAEHPLVRVLNDRLYPCRPAYPVMEAFAGRILFTERAPR